MIISQGYCYVQFKYYHPVLGCLTIDRFQRRPEQCKQIIASKLIEYQSLIFNVDNYVYLSNTDTQRGYDWYIFIIKDNTNVV